MMTRSYTKKRRAEQETRTRQRIVEATAALHEELGPRETTISAVAERAGVQRLTVYRHFPEEFALFDACTKHWLETHPPPDPEQWARVAAPEERTRAALLSLYRYYRRTAPMWTAVYRDVDLVPAMGEPLERFHDYLKGIRKELLNARSVEGARRRRTRGALGHLLRFSSWQTLKEEGMRDPEMARSGAYWIEVLASEPARRARNRPTRRR